MHVHVHMQAFMCVLYTWTCMHGSIIYLYSYLSDFRTISESYHGIISSFNYECAFRTGSTNDCFQTGKPCILPHYISQTEQVSVNFDIPIKIHTNFVSSKACVTTSNKARRMCQLFRFEFSVPVGSIQNFLQN